MSQTDTRTATQRIEDLEKVLAAVYQTVFSHKEAIEALAGVSNDMTLVKDALKLINRRVEGVVQAAKPESGITVDAVNAKVMEMTLVDLKTQVQGYLDNGHIVPAETVSDNAFLVCEELNSEGTVINPRIQFRLDSQEAATQESLKGKKAGDTVTFGDNKFSARILEVYALQDPNAAKAQETPTATTDSEAPQTEATAEEVSTTESTQEATA